MKTRFLAFATALALFGVASAALGAPVAARGHDEDPLTCGAVLTEDARLTDDLTCPVDGGITVRADVTIDLDGHRLQGPGSETESTGILVEDDHTLEVVDGTISGWGQGIAGIIFEGRPHADVRRLTFSDNGSGVVGLFSSAIVRSRFEGNGRGLSVWPGSATVDRSLFSGNDVGAYIGDASRLSARRSTFEGNDTGAECSQSLCDVTRSVLRENGTGLSTWFGRGEVRDNTFLENDRGAYLTYESSVVMHDNTFVRNEVGVEAQVFDNSVVRGNTLRSNGTGFRTSDEEGMPPSYTTIEGNRFTRNGDGVVIGQPGARIGGNLATWNSGWGIFAEGAEDLGENVVRRNGNEPQCVGVVCSSR